MTQGTRTPKPRTKPTTNPQELDLDDWLAVRGLTEKRMKIGGKWFRFTGSGTSEQVTAFAAALEKGDLVQITSLMLVDPTEADELAKAWKVQHQPLNAKDESEYAARIVNHLMSGADMGESSAS